MSGILELDIHHMNAYQAKVAIDTGLKRANQSIYRIRIIHGYHSGTTLKELIAKEYSKHQNVIRLEQGQNEGITELVLREL